MTSIKPYSPALCIEQNNQIKTGIKLFGQKNPVRRAIADATLNKGFGASTPEGAIDFKTGMLSTQSGRISLFGTLNDPGALKDGLKHDEGSFIGTTRQDIGKENSYLKVLSTQLASGVYPSELQAAKDAATFGLNPVDNGTTENGDGLYQTESGDYRVVTTVNDTQNFGDAVVVTGVGLNSPLYKVVGTGHDRTDGRVHTASEISIDNPETPDVPKGDAVDNSDNPIVSQIKFSGVATIRQDKSFELEMESINQNGTSNYERVSTTPNPDGKGMNYINSSFDYFFKFKSNRTFKISKRFACFCMVSMDTLWNDTINKN